MRKDKIIVELTRLENKHLLRFTKPKMKELLKNELTLEKYLKDGLVKMFNNKKILRMSMYKVVDVKKVFYRRRKFYAKCIILDRNKLEGKVCEMK